MQSDKLKSPTLDKLNAELKAIRAGVSIEQRGERLYLRATLPPKPGSGKTSPHQQTISLGIYANPSGFKRAKGEALRVSGLLACKDFRWEDLGYGFDPQDSIADWLQKFEADWVARRGRGPKSQTSLTPYQTAWKMAFPSKADREKPLNAETLINALLSHTDPDTFARNWLVSRLTTLARFAKIQVGLHPYKGSYTPDPVILPSDDQIEEWRSRITGDAWRWVFGIMATYGIRNHEIYYVDQDAPEFHQPPGVLVLRHGGKTGARKVWPYHPDWYSRWSLHEINMPRISGRSNSDIGSRVTQAFEYYDIPFTPYTLRHAWAVRTAVVYGLPVEIAAQMMGHSLMVHYKTYLQWIQDIHFQAAWEKSISSLSAFPGAMQPPS
jgi:integrase